MNTDDFEDLLGHLLHDEVPDAEQLYRDLEGMRASGQISDRQYNVAKKTYEQGRSDIGDPDY